MSWTISHSVGDGVVGYGDAAVWVDALTAIDLPARDQAVLEPLTRRRGGDPFEVEPRDAAAMASILRQNRKRMPRRLRKLTDALAAAAARASAVGQPWRWS